MLNRVLMIRGRDSLGRGIMVEETWESSSS